VGAYHTVAFRKGKPSAARFFARGGWPSPPGNGPTIQRPGATGAPAGRQRYLATRRGILR
jgi:hypothetical protein